MARTAKTTDMMVAERMAKMNVLVSVPARESALKVTGRVLAEAMRLAGEAEFNTQPRSKYRNALIN